MIPVRFALSPSGQRRIAAAVCLWLAGLVVVFAGVSLHWPMVGDAVLMHYVVLLMQHGMKPYSDIVDMNFPGSYLLDAAEMKLFGTGALAWRVYDFGLIAVASAAFAVILRRRGMVAVALASSLFALIHGADGILMTGERDFVASVFALVAVACLFAAIRRVPNVKPNSALVAVAGVVLGFACCIKPTFSVMAIFLFLWIGWLRSQRVAPKRLRLLPFVLGLLLAPMACFVFLFYEHSALAFVAELGGLIPYHFGIDRRSLRDLLANCLSPLGGIFLLWIAAAWRLRARWSDPERVALALCAFGGLLSYVLQGKGFWYQRYPLIAFVLPLFFADFSDLQRETRWPRWIGVAGVALGIAVASQCVLRLTRIDRREPPPALLVDLESFKTPAELSGHVQCMDTFGGCLDALYEGGILQSTGFLYDCYLMGDRGSDKDGAVVAALRRHFWEEMARNPPQVIVETDSVCYEAQRTFDKYQHWPEFQRYLAENFALVKESGAQLPVHYWSRPLVPNGYRIYLRRTDASAAR